MKILKYKNNPILSPDPNIPFEAKCVLNPGVIYDEEKKQFVMVYRAAGNDMAHVIQFGLAYSSDGFNFKRYSKEPVFKANRFEPDGGCVEDPRITKIGNTYFMTYAARAYAPGPYWLPEWPFPPIYTTDEDVHTDDMPYFAKKNITVTYIAATKDFIHYQRLGRITESNIDDRDVVIFPETINDKYVMISRPKFSNVPGVNMPSIWISFGDDLVSFDKPELLLTGGETDWEVQRVGISSVPIKTKYGWFVLYHGVDKKGVYRVGAIILDLNDPRKVLYRTKKWIMEPDQPFELEGIYDGCVFPTAAVVKDGVLFIYYGCADKHIGVATVDFDEMIEYLVKECSCK